MGSELYLHAVTEDEKTIVIRIPVMSLSEGDKRNIEGGGKIRFTFMPQAIHLFDKETELNIIPAEKGEEDGKN